MTDLIIKNSRIIFPDKVFEGGIVIRNGRIADIKKDSELPSERNVLNARGNYILPGLIDVHVHFREPGLSSEEDWYTGSRAAAAGGVTTVIDMPNTKPSTITPELLEKKRKIAESKSIVDYGFHFGATTENIEELKGIERIASVKFYMSSTTGNMLVGNDAIFFEELKVLAKRGLLATVHAENNNMVEYWAEKLIKSGRTDPIAYSESRPDVSSAEAAGRAILLSGIAGSKLHICHISTRLEVELLERNKNFHPNLTSEVTPHHLFLTKGDMKKLGNFAKTNPPLRSKMDQDALWKGINDGVVDILATDHAPHLPESKEKDVWNSPAGVPGLETMLPLLLNEVNKKNLAISKLVQITAENPARIFSIKNKGKIKRGYDADLVIVDLKKKIQIKNENLFTKCGWSPFNGWRLKGTIMKTILRGNIVFDEGDVSKVHGGEIEYNI